MARDDALGAAAAVRGRAGAEADLLAPSLRVTRATRQGSELA